MTQTLIIVIIDESGSMDSKKSDVLGGFNSFVRDQKAIESDQARLYLVKFNTVVSVIHEGIDLANVPDLTEQNYHPGGGTALFDAIAEAVRLAEKDKTSEERVICVIMTDGEENSSRETTKQQVKEIISGYEAKGDWTFLYIGENPERWTNDMGMARSNAVAYNQKSGRANLEAMNFGVQNFRQQSGRRALNLFTAPELKQDPSNKTNK